MPRPSPARRQISAERALPAFAMLAVLASGCSRGGGDGEATATGEPERAAPAELSHAEPGPAAEAPAPPPAPATRCRMDGPPLAGPCRQRPIGSIALAGGALYLVDGDRALRRYRVGEEGGCSLALDTGFADYGILRPPEVPERGQSVDGPVYLRSGGPDFRVAAGPRGEVLWFDYLGGVHAVGHGGALRGLCPDLLGVGSIAFAGDALHAARGRSLVTIHPEDGCAARDAGADEGFVPSLVAEVDGALHAAGSRQPEGVVTVMRIGDGGESEAHLGDAERRAPGHLCSAVAVAGCGAGVCVVDLNCRRVVRFHRDGEPASAIRFSQLLGEAGDVTAAASGGEDGRLFLAASMRRDRNRCEGAVFALAPTPTPTPQR